MPIGTVLIDELRDLCDPWLEANHALADYLRDQLEIISRLHELMAQPERADEPLDALEAIVRESEMQALVAALRETVSTLERNAAFDAAADRPTLNVRDFGAVGDGKADDGPAVRKALERARALGRGCLVTIPNGSYRICDVDRFRNHLLLDGVQDIVIQGSGNTVLLGTRIGTLLRMENCVNVRIRNIAIDFEPLPFTQGTIEAIDRDACTMDWRLTEGFAEPTGYPFNVASRLGTQPRDERGAATGHGGFGVARVEPLNDGLYRLHGQDPKEPDDAPARKEISESYVVGRPLALHTRNLPGHQPAVWITACRQIDLEGVNVWASYDHTILPSDCTVVTLRHCRVEPRPGTPRVSISNADGLHCRSNRIGPYVQDCTVLRNCDDNSNLYCRAVSVDKVLGPDRFILDARYRPEERTGEWQPDIRAFQVDDLLAFIDSNTGETAGVARVASLREAVWRGVNLLEVQLDRPIEGVISREALGKARPVAKNSEYLNYESEEPVEHFVVNLNTKSDGFVIRDCHFGENSVNGIKLKASNGIVRNNHFDNHASFCITLCMRMQWQEAYAPRNLLIEGNWFDTSAAVNSTVDYPGRKAHGPSYLTAIDIVGNHFDCSRGIALDLANLRDSTLRGNRFTQVPGRRSVHGSCYRLRLTGNTFDGRPLQRSDLDIDTRANVEVED